MVAGLNIAVCGAGIGGLSVAILLSRQGHRVTVLDQFDAPKPLGSGLMLQATGLAVLRELGLDREVLALGSRIDRLWGLTTPSNKAVLDVRYSAMRDGLFGLGVQRTMLFDQLYAAAQADGVGFLTSKRVESVDAETGEIGLQTGEYLTGSDLVIDALGVNSPLTRAPKRDLAYGALWATLPWPTGGAFDGAALEQRYEAARKMAGVMPSGRTSRQTPETLTYFWSIRADREDSWRAAPLDPWKEEASSLWPQTESLLAQISSHDQLTFARYRHRTHKTPVSGPRLIHLGDAWHAASPQLGQGANMALLDAFAAAMALRTGSRLADAVMAYKKLRATHVGLYQLMSWLFTPVYQGDGRLMPFLRDHLAAPALRIPPASKLLAAMVSGALGSPLRKLGLSP